MADQVLMNRRGLFALGGAAAVAAIASGAAAGTVPPLTASQRSAISASSPVKHTARQILASAARTGLALPTAMASPPTMTISAHAAATTISGGVEVLATDAVFNYLGAFPRIHNAYSKDFYFGGTVTRSTAPLYRGNALRARFGYGGRYLDLRMIGASASNKTYRVWIDGQPTAVAPRTDLTSGSQNLRVIMDLGSYASRVIEVECDQYAEFGGVTREKDYDVWFVPDTGPQLMGIGDSYFDGTGADSMLQSCFLQAAKRLGIANAWDVGEGGLGFVDDGTSLLTATQKFATDVQPYPSNWYVVALGINDDDKTASTVQTAATAYFAQLLAATPNAGVTVIGPWRAPSLNPPTAIFDAVKAAAQAQPEYATGRLWYADTLAKNWQQIAGYSGAVSGTGNSNVYIGADGAHPVQAGHDYLSERMAAEVVAHARALAA